jgi:hypothetical protein
MMNQLELEVSRREGREWQAWDAVIPTVDGKFSSVFVRAAILSGFVSI